MEPADWLKTKKTSKIGLQMIFSVLFFAFFGPRVLFIVSAEFCCHGKWGTGTNRKHETSSPWSPSWICDFHGVGVLGAELLCKH